MKQYLVKYEVNWVDELDVYGLAVLDEEEKQYSETLPEDVFPLTHYVGTNEEIEYTNKQQLLSKYNWTELHKEEASLLISLISSIYGNFYYPEIDIYFDRDYDPDIEEAI